jgi:hypothetical protein
MCYLINYLCRNVKSTRFCCVFGIRGILGETLACTRHLLAPTVSEASDGGEPAIIEQILNEIVDIKKRKKDGLGTEP